MMYTVRREHTVLLLCVVVSVLLVKVTGQSENRKCFADLGCFTSNQYLHSLPDSPEKIGTQFHLYTRQAADDPLKINATLHESEWKTLLTGSHISPQRDTKFITHGWQDRGTAPKGWVLQMKNEYLKKGDYNVFVVDWRHGAAPLINQASANTMVVAAQLAKFLQVLQADSGLDPRRIHLIGHSLGAHISGNAAHKTGANIHRVTGLDPAEPYFVHYDNSMRVDKSDAVFVDILHSDGEKFAVTKGFGMANPLGDIDFYPNGGIDQPGCEDELVAGIVGLLGGGNGLQCSHSRSHMYFIESINSQCKFYSRPCADWATYEHGDCHTCPSSGCPIMGEEADKSSARGTFYLTTTPNAPFCGQEYHVQVTLGDTPINTNGRLNVTLLGQHNSLEGELSRDNEQFHADETLTHVIAVNHLQEPVHGVRLRYHKHTGEPHVYIRKVLVEDLKTETRHVFCAGEKELVSDHPVDFTSSC